MFSYTPVIFSHLYVPWIKDCNIIAVTLNSWLVFSEHFHLHIESVLYLLSCKSLAITAFIKVFSLNYYSRFHSIWFYVLREVDKYAFMSFIRELWAAWQVFWRKNTGKLPWSWIIAAALLEKIVNWSFSITWWNHYNRRSIKIISLEPSNTHIWRFFSIGQFLSFPKNHWAITFKLLGNCPMAQAWLRHC